jgi:hypothetical protein
MFAVSQFVLEARAREEKVRLKLNPPSKSQLAKEAKKDALNHLATSEGIQVTVLFLDTILCATSY